MNRMNGRTPLTMITGPLGSGKTTLVRHLLDVVPVRMAILMNEFGEIAIDSKIIEGKDVRIAELAGGCVCCSLAGEFEAAVSEVIETVEPETIVVETTGLAEADALVFDIQERLSDVRLDGVIAVIDADAVIRFPQIGHTARVQIEAADVILLNKIDLVSSEGQEAAKQQIARLNDHAPIIGAFRCRVDPGLLFGIGRERQISLPKHEHQPEFESFLYVAKARLKKSCFEKFADRLSKHVYRAKGFVCLGKGSYLFNFVAGRWELEPFRQERTTLVFIGKGIKESESKIIEELRRCET